MNADVYSKIAIEVAVKAGAKDPFAFTLSSSNETINCQEVADGLFEAFLSLKMKAMVVNAASEDSALLSEAIKPIEGEPMVSFPEGTEMTRAAAQAIVSAALKQYDVTVFITNPLSQSETGMLLTAACGYAVLTEQKKVSRTDEIEDTLEIIRNLQARPIGFILK